MAFLVGNDVGLMGIPKKRMPFSTLSIVIFILCANISGSVGYYVGLLSCQHTCDGGQNQLAENSHPFMNEKPCPISPACGDKEGDEKALKSTFSPSISKFAVGMSRVPREDFIHSFEMGVPLQKTLTGNEQVLILYSHVDAQPRGKKTEAHGEIPLITNVNDATANCDYLNVILTDVGHERKQCIALMGQHEAYHVQRWMRIPTIGALNSSFPLRLVGRFIDETGRDRVEIPSPKQAQDHWIVLQHYLASIDSVLEELRPLAERAVRNNTLVVMFSNHGQSELIINFCCSARARSLDLSAVLVFATDIETKELLDGLGLTVFYDKRNFERLPSDAAKDFGDETFSTMMLAKVFCIQTAIMLGYDILFQDADIVWFKDPLPFFHNESLSSFDILLADDGSMSPRYRPYMGNAGFFYIRNNEKSRHLFNSLFLTFPGGNEQQQLNQLMSEYSSMYGMKIKVLHKSDFPTGVVYHENKEAMKDILDGKVTPFMFHMSWTQSKMEKLFYFRQMGEWFVKKKCIENSARSILNLSTTVMPGSLISPCCAAKPLISCHFSDMPSIRACKESQKPSLFGGESFW